MENKINRRQAIKYIGVALLGTTLAGKLIINYSRDLSKSQTNTNQTQQKHIIAHRRNSAKSIEEILNSNADMVEIDVRKTKDNIYIAFHDSEINKRAIKDIKYSELQNIPKFEDLLEQYGERIKWDIHLKEQGYEQKITELLNSYLEQDQFIVTSEHLDSLKRIRESNQETQLGLIFLKGKFYSKYPQGVAQSIIHPYGILKEAKENQINFIVPDYRFVTKQLLDEAQKQNIQIIPWVVNNQIEMQELLEKQSVYGVITDNPLLEK